MRTPEPRSDRGFVLIVVISALGILALVAASFAKITGSHVRTAAGAVHSAGAEGLADAGINLAILDLVANRQPGERQQRRFTLDGVPMACEASGAGRLIISVQDEIGKVDVNAADERLLRALLSGLGVGGGLADAIADYRDADGSRRPQGAEREDYASAGRLGPKNAPFSVVDELEQVLGIDAAGLVLLRPHVTVYSGQTGIQPNAASPALMRILSRGRFGSSFASEPAPSEPVSSEDTDAADRFQQLPPEFVGGSGGRFFAVRSEAHTGSAVFVREAIVEVARSRVRPFTLHRWYRGSLVLDQRQPIGDSLPPC